MELPHSEIFDFYEGDDTSKFTPLTGTTLNLAKSQLQDNINALNSEVFKVIYEHENDSISRDEDLNRRIKTNKIISENMDASLRNYIDVEISSMETKHTLENIRIETKINEQEVRVQQVKDRTDSFNSRLVDVETLLLSDDFGLDELQEVVDYIKLNRDKILHLDINSIAGLRTELDSKASASSLNGLSILENLAPVDGVNSGLDSDMLDGKHGNFYTNADNLSSGIISDDRISPTIKNLIGYGKEPRYDKLNAERNIIDMNYDSDENLVEVIYDGDVSGRYYRDKMTYTNNALSTVKHFYGTPNLTTFSGITRLTYSNGLLKKSIYTQT